MLTVMAVAVVGAAGLLRPGPTNASSHSAIRSFSAPWVAPGGTLEVTIVAQDYGSFGRIVETLPAGFSYAASDLAEAAVAVDGRTVSFTLLGERIVTYSVAAPGGEGSYSFAGVLLDENRDRRAIGGASNVRVGPPPPPGRRQRPGRRPPPRLRRSQGQQWSLPQPPSQGQRWSLPLRPSQGRPSLRFQQPRP